MSNFHSLTVKEIKKETPEAVSIVFELPTMLKNEFQFQAGQYLTLKKEINGEEVRRAYSICSPAHSNELRIVVKAVENGTFSVFATTLLKEGDVLEVSKPEGKFIVETSVNNSNNYLGIAAGSGITPIIAMVKTVLLEEPNSTFTLIYGNKTEADTIFKDEIDTLKEKFSTQFNIQYVFSREQQKDALFGRVDEKNLTFLLKNTFKNIRFHKAFLCGPEAMVKTLKSVLINNKVDEDSIYFELFTTSSKKNSTEVFKGTVEITVILDDEETTFEIDTKNTLLASALKEGLDAPYSCQGGICSSCLAKVVDGDAVMDKNSILSDEEISDGLILTCQAHSTTKKITIDYDNV